MMPLMRTKTFPVEESTHFRPLQIGLLRLHGFNRLTLVPRCGEWICSKRRTNKSQFSGERKSWEESAHFRPLWCALFGSLIYPTGEGIYTIHERKRHQEVAVHIETLIDLDPEAFWFVVIDNAPAHTTKMLDNLLQRHQDQIELVFLPTYSPHLNLIERLWRLMRGQMTKNQFYDTLKDLCEAVVDWLLKLPFAKFCKLLGIDESTLGFST
nr:transposase [bacterium]